MRTSRFSVTWLSASQNAIYLPRAAFTPALRALPMLLTGSRTTNAPCSRPTSPIRSFRRRFLSLVDQHHGNAVADRVTQAALRIGADDFLAFEFHIGLALGAGQDFEQLFIDHAISSATRVASL